MANSRKKPSPLHPIRRLFTQAALRARQAWQRKTRQQRSGLFIATGALFLLLCIPLAYGLLSINPYRPVITQTRALITSQPDLVNRLKTLDEFKASILPPTALQTVEELIRLYGNPNPAQPGTDSHTQGGGLTADSQQWMAVAHAILSLQKVLVQPSPAPQLANWLDCLHTDDALLTLEAIEQIYRHTPALLSQFHEIRRANLNLMQQLHAQIESRQLDAAAAVSATASAGIASLDSPSSRWRNLNRTSQSLEIQLANMTYLLNQILREIEPVYRQDQVWGFSLWLKTAAWIIRYQSGWLTFSAALLAIALMLLFGKPLPRRVYLSHLVGRLNVLKQGMVQSLPQDESNQPFAAQSKWLVKGLKRSAPATPLRISRRGNIQRPHLLIPVSGERSIEKPLPADSILRIGSDPAFPVKIPLSGAEYIELWIRKARKGYYLEVMFCDTAVRINQRPILSTCALHDGDTIQIHDTVLVFRER
ncbi:MAG: FHA domain-containing protein [Chloroflexota bacterium]